MEIEVDYETSPMSSALQWLDAKQTAGKVHPYVFSQCEVRERERESELLAWLESYYWKAEFE